MSAGHLYLCSILYPLGHCLKPVTAETIQAGPSKEKDALTHAAEEFEGRFDIQPCSSLCLSSTLSILDPSAAEF